MLALTRKNNKEPYKSMKVKKNYGDIKNFALSMIFYVLKRFGCDLKNIAALNCLKVNLINILFIFRRMFKF